MHKGFVQVSGEDLTVEGRKIRLRGFGIGSWLNMEHFMTGLPGNDREKRRAFAEIYGEERARDFFESYLSAFIAEDDIVFLKALGMNAVRLAFSYRRLEDDEHPGEYLEEGFTHLDRVIDLCGKHGMYAILDLHAAPGGQNPDSHADIDTGVALFWEQRCFRDRMVNLWRHIADRYKDNTTIAAYDLLNEPVNVPSAAVFNEFYDQAIEGIRQFDGNHLIFLEGDRWAQDFHKLHPPQDPQIAYSFHYYPLHAAVGRVDPAQCSRRDVERGLLPIIEALRERFNRPVWCGETGAVFRREEIAATGNVLRHTLDILEENNVSWTLWAYKDAGAMGLCHPRAGASWLRLVEKTGWEPQSDGVDTWAILDFLQENLNYPEIPEHIRLDCQFRLRGLLQCLHVEQALKPVLRSIPWEEIKDYPQDFAWRNCEYHREIADLVRGYARASASTPAG